MTPPSRDDSVAEAAAAAADAAAADASWIRNVDDGVEDGGRESGELVIINGVESSPVK